MILWNREGSTDILTNDELATVAEAERLGWTKAAKQPKSETPKKAEVTDEKQK